MVSLPEKMRIKSCAFKKRICTVIRNILVSPYMVSAAGIIAGLYLLMVFIYRHEHATVMETPFDAVWFFLVTFIGGYFDISPQTVPGRIASLAILLAGVLGFSALTGKTASVLLELQMKKDRGLIKLKNISGQFVLCGWRHGFEKILDMILDTNPDITAGQVVLINDAPAEQMENVRSRVRFRNIKYVAGDFTDEAVLERAAIGDAGRVLIISDYSKAYSGLEIDSRTVLAVLTIAAVNPGIYIAAELADSKFERHLRMVHCDEIILTTEYEHSLLASASCGQGYSNVMRALVGGVPGSGLIIEDIPAVFIGKTYGAYRATVTPPAVLIGLLISTGNFYQRRKDALREAQKNPDIKKIVSELKNVKLLKSNQPVLAPPDEYVIQPYVKAVFVKGMQKERHADG